MRNTAFALLLLAAAFTAPAHADGRNEAPFPQVQTDCAQVGRVSFGTGTRWSQCRVTKGRWFSTIGIIDLYQAQYCLGNAANDCDRRALTLFANRAYTPNAKMVLQRTDPAGTEYDDPLVVQSGDDDFILIVSARVPGVAPAKSYYRWDHERWLPVDAQAWVRDLARRLPAGISVRGPAATEVETMSARVPLSDGSVAEVDLGLAGSRFTVNGVKFARPEAVAKQ